MAWARYLRGQIFINQDRPADVRDAYDEFISMYWSSEVEYMKRSVAKAATHWAQAVVEIAHRGEDGPDLRAIVRRLDEVLAHTSDDDRHAVQEAVSELREIREAFRDPEPH